MALLQKAVSRQIILLEKTTRNNLDLEKLRLIGKKDLKKTRKKARPEWKAKGLKQEAEEEIKEEAKLEREAKKEK